MRTAGTLGKGNSVTEAKQTVEAHRGGGYNETGVQDIKANMKRGNLTGHGG